MWHSFYNNLIKQSIFMELHESMTEILNDLVMINNDRIAGYEKAKAELNGLDIDLKALFEEMIRQSNSNKDVLVEKIEESGGVADNDTSSAGKIYRAWMDIKSTFTASDRHSILAACEFGEDAALRAYESALASGLLLDATFRELVEGQLASLKKSHDVIKQQRSAHKALQSK